MKMGRQDATPTAAKMAAVRFVEFEISNHKHYNFQFVVGFPRRVFLDAEGKQF
jgi:hypothetical protein